MLGEFDEIGQLEELLDLGIQLRRQVFRILEAVEDLGGRHLLGIHAETGLDISPESIRDAGIHRLLLLRRPIFVAAVLVQSAQGHDVRRLLQRLGLFLMPVHKDQADRQDDQDREQVEAQDPGQDLPERDRIADLPLDVVGHERGRIDRHRPHVQDLGIEHQRIHDPVQRALHEEGRQLDHALLEGNDRRADPDVHRDFLPPAQRLPLVPGQEAVHPPGTGSLHAFHEPFGKVRKCVGGTLGRILEDESVREGIGHQGGITRQERFQERLAAGNDALCRGDKREKKSGKDE